MGFWKTATLCLLGAALLSCELFMAPMKGRWNPADPNNTLVPLDKNIYPAVDGSLDDTDVGDFAGPTLRVWYGTPMTYSLLRFNATDFPVVIDSVTLEIYCSSATSSGSISVYRIIQDWDPAAVSWSQVISGTFYDSALCSCLYPNTTPQYYSTDVTEMIRKSLQEGKTFGLLLCVVATANFDFHSSRNTYRPFLLAKGRGIP